MAPVIGTPAVTTAEVGETTMRVDKRTAAMAAVMSAVWNAAMTASRTAAMTVERTAGMTVGAIAEMIGRMTAVVARTGVAEGIIGPLIRKMKIARKKQWRLQSQIGSSRSRVTVGKTRTRLCHGARWSRRMYKCP